MTSAWLNPVAGLVFAPLLSGIIARVKAIFAGRRGMPLLQPYFDLVKLLRKGAVYSHTATTVFRLGPAVGAACAALPLVFLPIAGRPAPLSFPGDAVWVLYALALGRFATILAALDVGSSFEGMGASREAAFSALAEPALMVGLAALARDAGDWSLGSLLGGATTALWASRPEIPALLALAFFAVLLAENARIPVDDPNTHLELTMIHEVMVLDHSGPDFGLIQYGAALKLWGTGLLVVGLLPIRSNHPWIGLAAGIGAQFVLAIAIGVVESTLARLRLNRVPQLFLGAGALTVLAFLLSLWRVS